MHMLSMGPLPAVHSGPFGPIRGPFRSIRAHSGSFGSIRAHSRPTRVHSGPSGPIRVHSGLFPYLSELAGRRRLCTCYPYDPFPQSIRAHWGPFGLARGTFGLIRGPFGPIRGHSCPFGPIRAHSGPIRAHSGLFEPPSLPALPELAGRPSLCPRGIFTAPPLT